jgi:arabinose-5-phosphate isomerase
MKPIDSARHTLLLESAAVERVAARLGDSFNRAVKTMVPGGPITTTGIGKSGIVARKIAATLTSLGASTYFLHPTEALHGDLGLFRFGDTLIVVSKSGETKEIIDFLGVIQDYYLRIISITGNLESTVASMSNIVLDCSVAREACPLGLAPTASSTAAMAMGDALAIAVAEQKGFTAEDFRRLHPGGER